MGRKRLKAKDRPYLGPSAIAAGMGGGIRAEATLALEAFRARKEIRKEIAQNEEICRIISKVDSHREIWMWCLMAVILHRRYRWTADTISKIFVDIQNLHNTLYDSTMSDEELEQAAVRLAIDEVGLDIRDDDGIGRAEGSV